MGLFSSKKKSEKKKKGVIREWFDALVFAVIAATIIRWLFMEAFTIPTPSMEKSLLVGDFLFVSKIHYGARTPKTPLQLPLTHQTIWGTELPSYSSLIELPSFRLPGFTTIKNNDVVVFNYPDELDEHPVDLRTNYIKRCIGIPGDSLNIKSKVVYINGEPLDAPENMQSSYFIKSEGEVSKKVFDRYDITDVKRDPFNQGYVVPMKPSLQAQLKDLDFIQDVIEIKYERGNSSDHVFPEHESFNWTVDTFGPLYIPRAGDVMEITEENLILYGKLIQFYDGNDPGKVEINGGTLKMNGNTLSSYTFQQNYYFMMGDNRHNSLDSRFWGFVPEDHIIGKGAIIWMSISPESGNIFQRIRWNRIFKLIE